MQWLLDMKGKSQVILYVFFLYRDCVDCSCRYGVRPGLGVDVKSLWGQDV